MDMDIDHNGQQIAKYLHDQSLNDILYGVTIASLLVSPQLVNVKCTTHLEQNNILEINQQQSICLTCLVERFKPNVICHLKETLDAFRSGPPVSTDENAKRLLKECTDLKTKVIELSNKIDQYYQESVLETPEEISKKLTEPYFDCLNILVDVSRAAADYSPALQPIVRETSQEIYNMMSSCEKYLSANFVSVNDQIKNEFLNLVTKM